MNIHKGSAAHVRCADCKYACPDWLMSEKNWTAYQCGNADSDYYRALINIAPNGNKLSWISWVGCECGKSCGRRVEAK